MHVRPACRRAAALVTAAATSVALAVGQAPRGGVCDLLTRLTCGAHRHTDCGNGPSPESSRAQVWIQASCGQPRPSLPVPSEHLRALGQDRAGVASLCGRPAASTEGRHGPLGHVKCDPSC